MKTSQDNLNNHQQLNNHNVDANENGIVMNGIMPPGLSGWSDDECSPDHPKAKRFKVGLKLL